LDLPTNIALSDIDDITATLVTNDAWMILEGQEGVDKFGTGPLRDAFLALGHSKLLKDLNNLNGFLPKWNYPHATNGTLPSEWGAINNVRFLLSSVGSVDALASRLGNDVYNLFILGLESMAIVEMDNYSSRFLYRPPVYSDPLFQNFTLGTVFCQVPRILNDLWLAKVRVTLR
jgi:N4-gp56 family major capsid protein